VLEAARVQTRLAGGQPGTLPRRAVEETLEALHQFLDRAREREREEPRVVAVATSAVRDAGSRERILAAIWRNEAVDVQILTGHQEARLGALAALRSLPVRRGLIVDLGGASLQLTRIRRRRVTTTTSLPLGAVRMTARFLRHDPPTPRELRMFRGAIREALLDGLPLAERGEAMVGMGGTVRALASIHLRAERGGRQGRHGLRLQQSHVTAIRERLEPLSARKRARIRGLKAERADVILAGAIVIEEVMVLGGYLDLIVSTRGVRDGLLLRETFGRRIRR